MEQEEEYEREEEEEDRRDRQANIWLLPEAHFFLHAIDWARQWIAPRRVRAIALGLHGCGKSALLQRLQTGVAAGGAEATVVPVWHDISYKNTIFQVLDTSGFLDTRAMWHAHLKQQQQPSGPTPPLKAIIFVIDATNRELFASGKGCFHPPLATAVDKVPDVTTLLVFLLHPPPPHTNNNNSTNSSGSSEQKRREQQEEEAGGRSGLGGLAWTATAAPGPLRPEEVAEALQLLPEKGTGEALTELEATSPLVGTGAGAASGVGGNNKGEAWSSSSAVVVREGRAALSGVKTYNCCCSAPSGAGGGGRRRRRLTWRVQGECSLDETGQGLKEAMQWLWENTNNNSSKSTGNSSSRGSSRGGTAAAGGTGR